MSDPKRDIPLERQAEKQFGLDPVIETGSDQRFTPLTRFVTVLCPYCGGSYDSAVDLTQGNQQTVEDCQVCCASIEMTISVDAAGMAQIEAKRSDEA